MSTASRPVPVRTSFTNERAIARDGLASAYWPQAWIVTVIVLALIMMRVGELTGPVRAVKPVLTGTIAIFALHAIRSGRAAWSAAFRHRQVKLSFGYALAIVASVPFSIWRGQSFSLLTNIVFALSMIVVVCLTWPTLETLDRLLRWLSWVAAVSAVLIIAQGAVVEGSRITTEGSYDPNDLGALFALFLPLAIGASLRGRSVHRLASVVAAGIILAALLKTGSRGGLLALGAASIVFVFAYRPRHVLIVLFSCLVVLPAAWRFAPPVMQQRAASLFALEDDYNTTSNSGRVYLWKRGVAFAIANPLVGLGAGTFEAAVGKDFEEQGAHGAWHTAHNTYVQVFAELGVPGGVILLVLFARVLQTARTFWSWKSPVHRPELLAAASGYLVAIVFLSHAYTYLMFGFIALFAFAESLARRITPRESGRSMSTVKAYKGRNRVSRRPLSVSHAAV